MKFLTPLLAVIAVVSLISNALIYERFNTRKPIVTVGGQPISIYNFNSAMEAKTGAPILKKMVYTDLVRQAATKANVMPTEADVDARIKELQVKQPQLAQQASDPGVRDDLKTDLALENLRIQGVSASDAEVNSFYDRNKNLFTIPSQVQTTMVVSQRQGDASKAERLLQQDIKPETIAVQPGLHVAGVNGFNVNMAVLPPAVRQQIGKVVLGMKPGQIKTLPLPGNVFLTFKVKSAHGNEIEPLGQVKDQVARQVKLEKAVSPQQELASLYQSNTPVFNVSRYSNYFSDIQTYNAQKKTASAQ